jgi:hypothetical protein
LNGASTDFFGSKSVFWRMGYVVMALCFRMYHIEQVELPECIRSFARTYSASPIYHDMAAEAMSLVHPLTLLSVYEAEIHCF